MKSDHISYRRTILFVILPLFFTIFSIASLLSLIGYIIVVEPENNARNIALIEFDSEYVNRVSSKELRNGTSAVIKTQHQELSTPIEENNLPTQEDKKRKTTLTHKGDSAVKTKIISLKKNLNSNNKSIKNNKRPVIIQASVDPSVNEKSKQTEPIISAFGDIIEVGPYGPLPKISETGLKPLNAYASKGAADALKLPPESKKIAIVVGGLGLSEKVTNNALESFPQGVTLAFVPYAKKLQHHVSKARKKGHEVLLQVPMEPYGYPENDPGPHTLLDNLNKRDNLLRLYWLMSRFTDYIGITNYMGAKFVSNKDNLEFFISELRDRGLVYFDNGTSPAERMKKSLNKLGVPYALTDVVIDMRQEEDFIIESLDHLQTIARQNGNAIGYASAFPVSIKEISRWVKNLSFRGYELVPLSAMANAETQYATQ